MYHSICITMYLPIQINIYLPFYLSPTVKAGGSKRKSGAPDFFRLPCGAKAFCVYLQYTLPPRLMLKRP